MKFDDCLNQCARRFLESSGGYRNKRQNFLSLNPKNGEIIKPLLRGRDISHYSYELPGLYILLTKNGINVKRDYPDIYQYLDSFGDSFKKRGAKGQHWSNLRACAFFEDFKKLLYASLNTGSLFSNNHPKSTLSKVEAGGL